MKILLLTQGSQGLVALRELFANKIRPSQISVYLCNTNGNMPLIEYLNYYKTKYLIFHNSNDFNNYIAHDKEEFDVIISVGWKYILNEGCVLRFKNKLINLHPGLLPKYRGCFSTPWSIINNESYVGYTYHYIEKGIDTGNILIQEKIPIECEDTAHSLNYKIMQRALANIKKVIDLVILKEAGIKQEDNGNYYPNILPHNGIINDEWDSQYKERFIRAMYFPPFTGAIQMINGEEKEFEPR